MARTTIKKGAGSRTSEASVYSKIIPVDSQVEELISKTNSLSKSFSQPEQETKEDIEKFLDRFDDPRITKPKDGDPKRTKRQRVQDRLKAADSGGALGIQQGLLKHPFNYVEAGKMFQFSAWLRRVISTKARDLIGYGHFYLDEEDMPILPSDYSNNKFITFLEEKGLEFQSEVKLENGEKKGVAAQQELDEVINKTLIDYFLTGNAYIAIYKRNGEYTGYSHIPSQNVYVGKDLVTYFIAKRGGKRLGDGNYALSIWDSNELSINRDTGIIQQRERSRNYGNEIFLFQLKDYSPSNAAYGVSGLLSIAPEIALLRLARDYNLEFFGDGAMPRWGVIVTGVRPDEERNSELMNKIGAFFNRDRVDAGNKALVLVLEEQDASVGGSSPKVDFKELDSDIKEGSFGNLIKDARNSLLAAFAMPSYRLGVEEVGKLGGTNILKADEIYVNQELKPLRKLIERFFDDFSVLFGVPTKFRWNEISKGDNFHYRAEVLKELKAGMITPNEAREKLGYKKLDQPEADELHIAGARLSSSIPEDDSDGSDEL